MNRYEVLEAANLTALAALIEKYFKGGWRCQGGVFVVGTGEYYSYYQAMVHGK